jgi:Domain of unknown function (DUF4416)
MGDVSDPTRVLLVIAVISRHEAALEWARQTASQSFGPIALASDAFDFTETEYYTMTMGHGLKKQFIAFERLIDPAGLAEIKRGTNRWEADYAAQNAHAEPRPLNLDPGYITGAKLVLASTKDHAHRIYLRDGIYAELTLMYRHRRWQPLEWTYPDYRRADFHQYFDACREYLLNCEQHGDGVK